MFLNNKDLLTIFTNSKNKLQNKNILHFFSFKNINNNVKNILPKKYLIFGYNINFLYSLFSSYIVILLCDKILIKFFSRKARYFQLHSCINLIITYRIAPDIINFLVDPLKSYKLLDNSFDSYLILVLHFYHILITKKLAYVETVHHILFVLFGVLPTICFIKTNQIYLGYIACSGIPGIFEYGLLSLLKNNIITIQKQKIYTAYLYNYFRYPLALYGCYLNFIAWKYNKILNNDNYYLSIYINILLFLNGSVFNHLTIKSYYLKKINSS